MRGRYGSARGKVRPNMSFFTNQSLAGIEGINQHSRSAILKFSEFGYISTSQSAIIGRPQAVFEQTTMSQHILLY